MAEKITLGNNLELSKCPHCKIDTPNLFSKAQFRTSNHKGANKRYWKIYICKRCGGVVSAHSGSTQHGKLEDFFPDFKSVDDSLPKKAKKYLKQAKNSLHAPSGCVILCASAVDDMLKQRDYVKGSLYSRINKAAEDGILTEDMKTWAHEIRLDANDERHADYDASMAQEEDAKRVLNFADALAEYLYGLPNRVKRGIEKNGEED
ncbi:hypothetical protein CK503_06065 [Aliifodinibius salipaludis]|uniref:DUF4145 domain-containing protein n=1 Tax=Fodinibius salipaludis TaxID=2032627 RepID=A0A2A2GAK7_9BACT|nr:DUF4145 domain-containing protein [Aliifodinibius salipaludis]PAU94368.1 hypothetical protein CK503_06065 [Aliifodinibius salipaludis]